ncbi:MAG: xanthine dehydrogenase family protein molybdopterin-binding subunit, partial [Thermomicrobiales bacterium]
MVAAAEAPERMIGKALKRREDPRLIQGEARFFDDVALPGMVYAAFVRSPHAHATIDAIDSTAAVAMPGVVGVYTGEDFLDLNPLPAAWQAGGVENHPVTPRALCVGEVHQVGDPVAVVVAESMYQARDAAQAIDVRWGPLPAVVDARKATEPGAPQLHEEAPNNIVLEWSCGREAAEVDTALSRADVRISHHLVNQRLIPMAMEPRGSIAR